MRKKVHKLFLAWNFDKEEIWLNQMANDGWGLVAVGFGWYEFEPCASGEYTYRLELLEDAPQSDKSRNYIQFLEDTGIEQVGSYLHWCYFRRKAADGEFDLFSDFESRIKHLTRIQLLFLPVMILNLANGLNNFRRDDLSFAGINLFAAAVMLYGIFFLARKKKKLEKEKQISEN